MTKKSITSIIIIFFCISCIFIVFSKVSIARFFEEKPMTPILDNNIVPEFKLNYCKGYESTTNWKERGVYVPEKVAKKFKSKKYRDIEENWIGTGVIRIFRWYFEYPEDAVLFPYTTLPVGSLPFPGWAEKPDIGDKTCWWGNDCIFFTKGKVLIKIYLSAELSTMSKSQQEALLRRIAEYISKKL